MYVLTNISDLYNYKFNWQCTCLRLISTSVTTIFSSTQASSRHTKRFAYRCFLPDLTGFTSFRCVRPGFHCHLRRAVPTVKSLLQEFSPAAADCRYRAPLPPRLARPSFDNKNITEATCTLYLILFLISRQFEKNKKAKCSKKKHRI